MIAGGVSPRIEEIEVPVAPKGRQKEPMSHASLTCHIVFSVAPSGLAGPEPFPFRGLTPPAIAWTALRA